MLTGVGGGRGQRTAAQKRQSAEREEKTGRHGGEVGGDAEYWRSGRVSVRKAKIYWRGG